MAEVMTLRKINGRRKKIIAKIEEDMKSLGVFKEEFRDTIDLYADCRLQYDAAWNEYIAGGMRNVVECPGGVKKNPVLTTLEDLRKTMMQLQDKLALNPKSLDAMRQQGAPEESGLDQFVRSWSERSSQNGEAD